MSIKKFLPVMLAFVCEASMMGGFWTGNGWRCIAFPLFLLMTSSWGAR